MTSPSLMAISPMRPQIEAEHGENSLAGQSEVVQDVNTHFVAFV